MQPLDVSSSSQLQRTLIQPNYEASRKIKTVNELPGRQEQKVCRRFLSTNTKTARKRFFLSFIEVRAGFKNPVSERRGADEWTVLE